MANSRTFLLVALAFVTILLWQAWDLDFSPKPTPEQAGQAVAGAEKPASTATTTTAKQVEIPTPQAIPASKTAAPQAPAANEKTQPPSEPIEVRTNVLHLTIDARGGTIIGADLLDYPLSQKDKNTPVKLLNDQPQRFFIAQSGLVSAASPAPNHQALYKAEKTHYAMAQGQDTLEVPLTWQDPSGLKVRKTFVFKRGSYLIELREQIDNATQGTWNGNAYRQLQRVPPVITSHGFAFSDPERYAFAGAAWYSPQDKFKKLAFNKFSSDPLNATVSDGWVAMLQHYFFAAWIPATKEKDEFSTALVNTAHGVRYLIRALSPGISVPGGQQRTITTHLYIGPTLQNQLEAIDKAGIAKGLELTADYGMLTPIAQPMHWILVELHKLVRNWGLAIILLVLLIKLALFKISEAQYRSMAKMRKLQPRMQALKERYGDDKQKLSTATMELYKKEKINPLGGCIPTLIQIPVFFALYYVLLESVELRQAPFFGWIQNLSAPDPYYVLPVINALIMIGAQWLTPASPGMDPTQAKMMKAMPLFFAVLFLFFPAGLVLYYTVNGGLSLLQQWIITQRIQAAEKHAR